MSHMRHNAIIATASKAQAMTALVEYARSLGAEVIVGGEVTNAYVTACITPDGSKEGWQTSKDGDERRTKIKTWLRNHPENFEWCEVAYGDDDEKARITDSAW